MDRPVATYYTLRFVSDDSMHRAGERVAASQSTVRIGQQEDCDVRFGNASEYADELFAVVRPCCSGDGWLLIPCSEFVRTTVNGTSVELVHYLADGDRIGFGDERQELLFSVCRDEKYDLTAGAVHIAPGVSRRLIALLAAVPLLLFAVLGWSVHRSANADKRLAAALGQAKPSVLHLCVDSVFYVETTPAGSNVLRRLSLADGDGSVVSGSAFLTADSLLLTARHCIEPWLNNAEIMTVVDPASLQSVPVRWALEAETYNQTHAGDTTYRVVSGCFVESSGERFLSSDFSVDTSRDDIVDMGDYDREFYWRSLRGRHDNRTMMLGDIAVVKSGRAGTIAVAPDCDMESLLHEGAKICFMGYPDYETGGLEYSRGEVKRGFSRGEMIVHDGSSLKHGYSGGPVFVIQGERLVAVGVISVVDANGGNRIYSVPVSERAAAKGGER